MEVFNNQDGINLPASTIGDLILPFVDRKTWNNLILSNREIYQASKKLEPPWPRGDFLTNDHHSIRRMAFSSDGKYYFGQTNGRRIHVWHKQIGPYAVLDPNAPRRLDSGFPATSMASSPTENLLVTGCSDGLGAVLLFWDIASLSVISEVDVSGNMVVMNVCGFSPDGSLVACNVFDVFDVFDSVYSLHIYSASDAVCIKTIATNRSLVFGGFSPDSQTVVACFDGRVVRVWDLMGDDDDTSFQDLSPWVPETAFRRLPFSLPFSPKGQSIVIGTVDANACKLAQYQNYIWVVKVLEFSMEVNSLYFLFSPGGRLLATRHKDGVLTLWDPVAGKLVQTLGECQHPPTYSTFSGDGRMLATANDEHSHYFSLWPIDI
jgi:WD40 repeat protein